LATAYVLINCELGAEEFVISELKSIEGVQKFMAHLVLMTYLQKSSQVRLRHCVKPLLGKLEKFQKYVQP